jgi:perosamine synthetase
MPISRLHCIPRFALPYTAEDFAAGLKALFTEDPPAADFPMFAGAPKFWTGSGRQALSLLLRAFRLKPGGGIALPLFTDPSLIRAIVAAGHRPVFIDVDPSWLTIDPQSLEENRGNFVAIIAVHLFGHLADMPAVMKVAGSTPVIEDVAHAPLCFLNDRLAGTFGIAAFFSFASTKYWPAGGGGLAIVNDQNLARDVAKEASSLAPSWRLREARALFLQAAKAVVFHRRLYGICGRPLRRWAETWALLEPSLDWHAIQRPWSSVACRQGARMAERVTRQRANSLDLLVHLATTEGVVLPRERPGARYNYHLFPVLLRSTKERSAVTAAMWSKFVDSSMIYSNVVTEARRFGYTGGCPIAESIADRLITLPNYASLSARDIEIVAHAFLSSLQTFRRLSAAQPPI